MPSLHDVSVPRLHASSIEARLLRENGARDEEDGQTSQRARVMQPDASMPPPAERSARRAAATQNGPPPGRRGTPRPSFEGAPQYYDYVAHGYDQMATAYDGVEGLNTISERVRATSVAATLRLIRPGQKLLELGCGTGRDAVTFARQGIHVTATDVSPNMVRVTRERADREGVGDLVLTCPLSAADAAGLEGPFDGVYSNGAVLNLEPDLDRVAFGLRKNLLPGGFAILTAANRISLFELALYPIVLRPRKAFRKLGHAVPIPISRKGFGQRYVVPTGFLTPKEFRSRFREGFEVLTLRGLEVITPPWNLVDLARLFRAAVAPLERLEDRIGSWPGFRSLGAIYLYVLQRTAR